MAIATGENLDATARVMYRGCSICCAFTTILISFIVAQAILTPYSPLTPENAIILILLMVGGPALMTIILFYMSRHKRVLSTDAPTEDWSNDDF